MKWEDFIKINKNEILTATYERTDIECPKCGVYVYKDITKIYTSNPPKHKYYCPNCNWSGFA